MGTTQQDGWLSPLNKAIYPPIAAYRNEELPVGCSPPETYSVLDMRLIPGGHRIYGRRDFIRLRAERTRWSGGTLRPSYCTFQPTRPSEHRYIDAQECKECRGSSAGRAYATGQSPKAEAEFEILIPSEMESPEVAEVSVHLSQRPFVPTGPWPAIRHPGARRCAMLRSTRGDVILAKAHGRAVGATPDEIVAALAAVEEALNHPLLQRARAARVRYRELLGLETG